jgi:hypothetical protein
MKSSKAFWLGAILAMCGISAHATQIYVSASTTNFSGDPNVLTDTSSFYVGTHDNNAYRNPLYVVIGSYDGSRSGPQPSLSYTVSGTTRDATVAQTGVYDAHSRGSAYAALGLNGGNASENWANWSAADQARGLAAPSFFTLYEYRLNTDLPAFSSVQLHEQGAANGSYLIAYDYTSGGCRGNGNQQVGSTPFTVAALVDNTTIVPEPLPLGMMAMALTGLGLARWRSRRRPSIRR